MIFVGQKTINTFLLHPLMALSGQYDADVLAGSIRSRKESGPISCLSTNCYNILFKDWLQCDLLYNNIKIVVELIALYWLLVSNVCVFETKAFPKTVVSKSTVQQKTKKLYISKSCWDSWNISLEKLLYYECSIKFANLNVRQEIENLRF